jgi:hypothetical protein
LKDYFNKNKNMRIDNPTFNPGGLNTVPSTSFNWIAIGLKP